MPLQRRSVALIFGVAAAAALSVSLLIIRKTRASNNTDGSTSTRTKKTDQDNTTNTISTTKRHESNSSSSSSRQDWSEHLPSHMIRLQNKEKRRQEKIPLLAMKSQMYDNITMLDPQGVPLSKISAKKARWYVNKGIAEWKGKDDNDNDTYNDNTDDNENSKSIQLKFEPKARSDEGDYGRSTKENVCVACGDEEGKVQMRFHIVPHTYRSLFPMRYKTHMSHDVVLLCADCHLRVGQASNLRMNELEDRFMPQQRYSTDFAQYKVRSSALALMNWKHKIPKEKVASHEEIVRTYLALANANGNKEGDEKTGNDAPTADELELTDDLLQSVIDVEHRIENPNYIPGPEMVVNSIVDNDVELAEFIREWRRFFLDTIHPRHLPNGWSVDYPVACDM
jgi:hypothetical protein